MFNAYCKRQGFAIAFGLLLAFFTSSGSAQTPTKPSAPSQVQTPDESLDYSHANHVGDPNESTPPPNSEQMYYRISPGDTLEITVFGAPDLSQKVRVTSEGDAYLPLVNYVHVAGLNVQEAQAAIEHALKKGNFLTSPHVSIFVAEYASGVVVMGEVVKPGIYPVTASKGLLFDILTEAGGPTASAGQVVTITHRGDTKQQTVVLSQNPKNNMEANVPVYQGDTILVSKAGTIYVVGEVLSPSAFIMERKSGYTALKALAMAHGPTRLAKLSQAIIVRQTPEGVKQIPVPLDKIAQNKAPDTELLADDILMVPTNHAKSAALQAVAMAQSIAVLGAVHAW
jgi:polysaccharide export outer membrane protein